MEIFTNSSDFLEDLTPTIQEVNSLTQRSYNSTDGNSRKQSILAIQSTVASVGIVANLTVIVVFLNHKKFRRKIPIIFIINQSSADFLCSLMLLLSSLTIYDQSHIKADGILGYLECITWNGDLFMWSGFVTSTWNLVCLTIERYVELVHPIWHRTHFKMRYIYMAIVFVWVLGFGLNAAYMFPTGKVIAGICRVATFYPSDEVKTVFGVCLIFIQFIIPCMVLIICYGKIIWVLTKRIDNDLRKTQSKVENSDNSIGPGVNARGMRQFADPGQDKFQLARRNTIKTLLIVACCFIICWSQNQILFFLYTCGYNLNFNSLYFNFTILMVFINCTVNPFIYLIKYRDYHEALRAFLNCSKNERDNNSFSSPPTSQTSRSTQD